MPTYPRFPVGLDGFRSLHAPFLKRKAHTLSCPDRCEQEHSGSRSFFARCGRRGSYSIALSRYRHIHSERLRSLLSVRHAKPWCGSVYTAGMYQIRAATPADAAVITHHRRRMFVDAGRQNNRVLDVMAEHFKPWVETRLADGRYMGWLTSEDGTVVAGAGLDRARLAATSAGSAPG